MGTFPGTHLVLWCRVVVLLDRREVLVSSLAARSSSLLEARGTWTHPSNPPSSGLSAQLFSLHHLPLLLLFSQAQWVQCHVAY